MNDISNAKQYSEFWSNESDFLEFHHIYEKLANISPEGNVLEVGCGVGNGTLHLSKNHNVLSLDSNLGLINEAEKRLDAINVAHNICRCDFFSLSEEDKQVILDFEPKVIAGWFIGSHGEDIYKHTTEEPDFRVKSKLYREKIEDIVISKSMCVDTVEYIHLVSRGGVIDGFTEADIFKDVKDDYDTYVFNQIGFEVIDVKQIPWPRDGSTFQYGSAPNPNLAQGNAIPMITSLIAKKMG